MSARPLATEPSEILDITGARLDYSAEELCAVETLRSYLPRDLLSYMTRFGVGEFNGDKMGLHPVEKWHVATHPTSHARPVGNVDWLKEPEIIGVCLGWTNIGDQLIATGETAHGVVLKSRCWDGCVPLGATWAEVLRGVFASPHWGWFSATRVFFHSRANRRINCVLRKDTPLQAVMEDLAARHPVEEFRNEYARCYYYPEERVMVSLENQRDEDWAVGFSSLQFTCARNVDHAVLAKWKEITEQLGFVAG